MLRDVTEKQELLKILKAKLPVVSLSVVASVSFALVDAADVCMRQELSNRYRHGVESTQKSLEQSLNH